MKNRWIMGWVLWIWGACLGLQAQTYDQLWKEVEQLDTKDLPRSVIAVAQQIGERAEREQNRPQWWKAYLLKMRYRALVAPDSLSADLRDLEQRARQTVSVDERALSFFFLGEWMLEKDLPKGMAFIQQALQEGEALRKVPAARWQPLVESGATSRKYFRDNLYDLLVRRALGLFGRYRWKAASLGNQTEQLPVMIKDWRDFQQCTWEPQSAVDVVAAKFRLYRSLAEAYKAAANRPAFLLTSWQAMQDLHRTFPQQFTAEAYEQLLKTACATESEELVMPEVWLLRAEWLSERQRYAECLQVVREALHRYPRFGRANRLRNLEQQILQPSLQLAVDPAYPGEQHTLRLSYKNLTGFTLQLYKVDLPVTAPALQERARDFERKYATLQREETFGLRPTTDYQLRDTLLHFQAPQPGVYWLKAVPQGGKGKSYGALLYVTSLQVLHRALPDGKMELVVVDGQSGHPVPGAELVTYTERGGGYAPLHTFSADEQGTLHLDFLKSEWVNYRVRTMQDDAMPVSSLWANRYQNPEETCRQEHLQLFTDRSLYRPGQTVYVSGLAYQQMQDDTHVLADRSYTLTLCDANGSEVGKQVVNTSSFGSFQTQFTLPSTGLTGMFRLKAGESSAFIQVEAYKRPTFEVTFEPVKESYQAGDSLRLKGVAKTFAGASVQQAKVRYTVTRSSAVWWRMPGVSQSRWEGEALTDAEGRFEVPVHFQVDVSQGQVSQWYYTYQVTADVTDGAGESHRGECTLPLASVSLRLQVEKASDRWVMEKLTPIRVGVYSLTGEPLDKEVRYQVVELQGEISGKILQEGAVVDRGVLLSNRDFLPESVKALPAGRYRWKISVTDAQGRPCTATFDFLLFSQEAQRPPVRVIDWFYQEGEEFNEQDVPVLSVGSSASDVYLFYDVFAGHRRLESRRMVFSDSILHFRFPYQEVYGDGIRVQVAFWKNGKLYRHDADIRKPLPDKRLQLKWSAFRNRLQPGQKEEWRLKVQYPDGRPAEAELLATMYDASLDPLFRAHRLPLHLSFARRLPTPRWEESSWSPTYVSVEFPWEPLPYPFPSYSTLWWPEVGYAVEAGLAPRHQLFRTGAAKLKGAAPQAKADRMAVSNSADFGEVSEVVFEEELIPLEATATRTESTGSSISEGGLEALRAGALRTNLNETAFFYPQLRTDAQGEVSLSFVLPEGLTRWRFLGLAHTRAVDYGTLEAEVTARKEFMLQPVWPRFVRVGDRTTVSASLVNLSAQAVRGMVRLELFHPVTERVFFRQKLPFNVEAGRTGQVSFAFQVKDESEVWACRMVAEGDTFSDGEQQYLPVLSDQQWVTETYPLYLNGAGRKAFALDSLFNHHSPTASSHRLTVEWTANPMWYAVQVLPVLANPRQEDAFAWAAAYYATSLAAQLVHTHPQLRSVVETWKTQQMEISESNRKASVRGASSTVGNVLAQNEELKGLLLEETPWVLEAKSQTEQCQQLVSLLEPNALNHRQTLALEKMRELQRPDGSWSWYKGMEGSRLVTTQILEWLARTQALSGQSMPNVVRSMFQQGLRFLEKHVLAEYQRMKEAERKGEKSWTLSEETVRYLYLRVLTGISEDVDGSQKQRAMQRYFLDRLPKWGARNAIYQKALAAVVLQGYGRSQEAREQLQSVMEYSVYTDELGRYFDTPKAELTWRNYQLPTQVMALEALQRLTPDSPAIDEMKRWLLKQKQVQAWESSVATVDAVYALWRNTSKEVCVSSATSASSSHQVSDDRNRVNVRLGSFRVQTQAEDVFGYTKHTWDDEKVASVQKAVVEQSGKGTTWGAVYAQYRESLDRVQAQGQGVRVERRWFREGKEINVTTPLQVGDRLTVQLTVTTDRNLDFVQLKDERAACLEPLETLSGYCWNGSVGYYRSIQDASVWFFFDYLPKGTYTVSYSVYVTRRGVYQSGLASVQSAYAPAFGGHTDASSLTVE